MLAVKKASDVSGLNKVSGTSILPSNEAIEKKMCYFSKIFSF